MTEKKSKRRDWFRRIGTVACVIAGVSLLIPAALVWSHYRGQYKLDRELKKLADEGEVIDWRKLVPPATTEENGAPILLAAKVVTDGASIRGLQPNPGLMVGPGVFAQFTARSNFAAFDSVDRRVTRADWALIERVVQTNKVALADFKRALSYPVVQFNVDYTDYPITPVDHLTKVKDAARWIRTDVMVQLQKGDFESAHEGILEIIKLSESLMSEGVIISRLVAISVQRMAFNCLVEGASVATWNDDEWSALQNAFAREKWVDRFQSLVEMERALKWSYFESVRENIDQASGDVYWVPPDWWETTQNKSLERLRRHVPKLTDQIEFGLETAGLWWNENLFTRIWRYAWLDHDAVNFLQSETEMIRLMRSMTNNSSATSFLINTDWDKYDVAIDYSDRMVNQFSWLFNGFSFYQKILERHLFAEHRRQLAITVCALHRYNLKNETPPPDLMSLVPDFLKSVPLDPGDGQPLRYSAEQDGGWTLYSIGIDGVDDGGDGNPSAGDFFHSRQAKDYLWPRPATSEEFSDYQKVVVERIERQIR